MEIAIAALAIMVMLSALLLRLVGRRRKEPPKEDRLPGDFRDETIVGGDAFSTLNVVNCTLRDHRNGEETPSLEELTDSEIVVSGSTSIRGLVAEEGHLGSLNVNGEFLIEGASFGALCSYGEGKDNRLANSSVDQVRLNRGSARIVDCRIDDLRLSQGASAYIENTEVKCLLAKGTMKVDIGEGCRVDVAVLDCIDAIDLAALEGFCIVVTQSDECHADAKVPDNVFECDRLELRTYAKRAKSLFAAMSMGLPGSSRAAIHHLLESGDLPLDSEGREVDRAAVEIAMTMFPALEV